MTDFGATLVELHVPDKHGTLVDIVQGFDTVAGYVILPNRDMTRVERLVNMLRMQGIEIGKATGEVKLREGTFPAGSFIVKRDQPYGRLA